MAHYYVNKNAQPTGEHEVHTSGCSFLPEVENRIYLGNFYNCRDAVKEAKEYYSNVDGCSIARMNVIQDSPDSLQAYEMLWRC